jgi:hypothetical protein
MQAENVDEWSDVKGLEGGFKRIAVELSDEGRNQSQSSQYVLSLLAPLLIQSPPVCLERSMETRSSTTK